MIVGYFYLSRVLDLSPEFEVVSIYENPHPNIYDKFVVIHAHTWAGDAYYTCVVLSRQKEKIKDPHKDGYLILALNEALAEVSVEWLGKRKLVIQYDSGMPFQMASPAYGYEVTYERAP